MFFWSFVLLSFLIVYILFISLADDTLVPKSMSHLFYVALWNKKMLLLLASQNSQDCSSNTSEYSSPSWGLKASPTPAWWCSLTTRSGPSASFPVDTGKKKKRRYLPLPLSFPPNYVNNIKKKRCFSLKSPTACSIALPRTAAASHKGMGYILTSVSFPYLKNPLLDTDLISS